MSDEIVMETNTGDDEESTSYQEERAILFLSGDIERSHLEICGALLNWHYTDGFNEPIYLIINSNGGDCSIGWSIIDMMNYVRLPIYTIAIGIVASMAADIFANGDHRTIGEHASLMIHPHSAVRFGSHSQLVAHARADDLEHNRRLAHYANNSKYNTVKDVQENLFNTMGDDLWLSPDEALEHGICDEIARTDKSKRRKAFGFVPKGHGEISKHPARRRSSTGRGVKRKSIHKRT